MASGAAWGSDNPAVATVSATGLVTAVGAGRATIFAGVNPRGTLLIEVLPAGTVTDPLGDTLPNPGGPSPVPDFVSGTVLLGTDLFVTVRFRPGTFDPMTTAVLMRVDADANAGTGYPIHGLGEELLVWMGATIYEPGLATVVERDRGVRGSVPQNLSADAIEVVFPRALLGPTASTILFRFEVFTRVGSPPDNYGTDTRDLDWMPDGNLPPGRSRQP